MRGGVERRFWGKRAVLGRRPLHATVFESLIRLGAIVGDFSDPSLVVPAGLPMSQSSTTALGRRNGESSPIPFSDNYATSADRGQLSTQLVLFLMPVP